MKGTKIKNTNLFRLWCRSQQLTVPFWQTSRYEEAGLNKPIQAPGLMSHELHALEIDKDHKVETARDDARLSTIFAERSVDSWSHVTRPAKREPRRTLARQIQLTTKNEDTDEQNTTIHLIAFCFLVSHNILQLKKTSHFPVACSFFTFVHTTREPWCCRKFTGPAHCSHYRINHSL